jgi:hypothetical protein
MPLPEIWWLVPGKLISLHHGLRYLVTYQRIYVYRIFFVFVFLAEMRVIVIYFLVVYKKISFKF